MQKAEPRSTERRAKDEGRPKGFDVEEALDRALAVFWERGYEGASIAELTEAMGINRPSLYATYGNKEGLFAQALDRYVQSMMGEFIGALEAPTARECAERMLYASADAGTARGWPKGCFGVRGALVTSEAGEPVRRLMVSWRVKGQRQLERRLERAKEEDDLSADVNTADLARFVLSATQGMAVQAATGATRRQLYGIIEQTMRAWPR